MNKPYIVCHMMTSVDGIYAGGAAHTYQRPRDRGARNGAARKV